MQGDRIFKMRNLEASVVTRANRFFPRRRAALEDRAGRSFLTCLKEMKRVPPAITR